MKEYNQTRDRTAIKARSSQLVLTCLDGRSFGGFTGKHHTEETKARISALLKGRPSPLKGKPHSKVHNQRASDALKQKHLVSWIAGLRKETDPRVALIAQKVKQAQLGRPRPGDPKNWKHTEQTREKLSQLSKGRHQTEETKRKISESSKGHPPRFIGHHSEENKKKISKALSGRPSSVSREKRVQIVRAAHLRGIYWQNPEYVKKQMQSRGVRPNKLERRLDALLNKQFPRQFKYVGDGQLIIAGKCPDFWNGDHKLLELYGNYWHEDKEAEERVKLFKEFGYDTLIIWESELKDIGMLVSKVSQFLGGAYDEHQILLESAI